jgi:hypothetical protein
MRALTRIMRRLHILLDYIQLRSLLMYHVRHISKQFIEFANTLLDVTDLGFALDDEGFLEVDFVLVGEAELFLLLLLLGAKVVSGAFIGGGLGVEGGAGGLGGGLFFFESGFLELLEFLEGGTELALELGLCEFLAGLGRLLAMGRCGWEQGTKYPDVRPCGDLLDAFANFLEGVGCLFDGGLHALSYTGGFVLRTQLGYLG